MRLAPATLYFAFHGASLTFTDVVPSNVELVRRLCAVHGIAADFLIVGDLLSLQRLGEFDAVYCGRSLLHVPLEVARMEAQVLLEHLPAGGRWVEMAYPKTRRKKEGRMPEDQWGYALTVACALGGMARSDQGRIHAFAGALHEACCASTGAYQPEELRRWTCLALAVRSSPVPGRIGDSRYTFRKSGEDAPAVCPLPVSALLPPLCLTTPMDPVASGRGGAEGRRLSFI
jgi:hypothetical protein